MMTYLTKTNYEKIFFIVPLVVFFILGCQKEKEDINPLLGEWEMKSIYTKYTNPVAGLREETIDVKTFLSKNGYYPLPYKTVLFYGRDSVTFITSELFTFFDEEGFLYTDPDKTDDNSRVTDRIRASYKLEGNSVIFQLEPLAHSQKLTYRYAFVNGFLELTVKDINSELDGKPVIHKELWTLRKTK